MTLFVCCTPDATYRINYGGKLDIVCFDKTGTLTEEGLDVSGVHVAHPSGKRCVLCVVYTTVHCVRSCVVNLLFERCLGTSSNTGLCIMSSLRNVVDSLAAALPT